MTDPTYHTTYELVRAYVAGKVSFQTAHRALVREGRTNVGATNVLNWARRLDEWKKRNAADHRSAVVALPPADPADAP